MSFRILGLAAVFLFASPAAGLQVQVTGGLNFAEFVPGLANNTILVPQGVTPEVIIDPELAFPINAPADARPTTFTYDTDDFENTFSGVIESAGSVIFGIQGTTDAIAIGDFTVDFDPARIGNCADCGFFLAANTGFAIPLYDISAFAVTPGATGFQLGGDLLMSAEFAAALLDQGLAQSDLTGLDLGDIFIDATVSSVPEAGLALAALPAVLGMLRRGKRRA